MASFQSTPRIALSRQTADALGSAIKRLQEQTRPIKIRPIVFKDSPPSQHTDSGTGKGAGKVIAAIANRNPVA